MSQNDERRLVTAAATTTSAAVDDNADGGGRPTAAQRLATPGAVLSRTDLRSLGFERRAVDAIFRALPVVVLPGYSRPLVRAEDYLKLVASSTYAGDRVRAS